MSSLWNWISGSLSGFLEYLGFSRKSGKLLIIGLDNAGKTTLLKRLKEGTMGTPLPTWFLTKQELSIGGISFTAFDAGGHQQVRKVWKTYFPAVDAIVFIVDASDRQRLSEARSELESLLSDEFTTEAPFLLLGNKIDRPGAASEEELRYLLGLHGRTTGKAAVPAAVPGGPPQPRPFELFMCSVLKEQGYGEALRWLMSHI